MMDKELINLAIRSLNIENVHLGSHEVTLAEEFDPGSKPPRISTIMNWGPKNAATLEANDDDGKELKFLRITFQTLVQVVPTPEGGKLTNDNIDEAKRNRIATIKASFTTVYSVRHGAELSEDVVSEFAHHNAPLHMWPYWREFLQSTCERTGLPRVQLRMYQVRRATKPPDTRKTSEE